jgi:hypothetical protein
MKPINMRVTILCILMAMAVCPATAQKSKTTAVREIRVPMEPAHWEYDTANVAFGNQNGTKIASIKNGASLFLKNEKFSNGIIEYDVELGGGFPGISFRMSEDRKDGETFYLRYFGSTSPDSRTTLQYCAVIDGMSMWDLTDEYQAGATLKAPGWNHVRLLISGRQMRAYVNDMSRPALIVPVLEGGTREGGIFFSGGQVAIANVVIRPGVVEDLSPVAGYTSSYNDTRYLRNWQVSAAREFPQGNDIVPPLAFMGGTRPTPDLPDSALQWKTIKAEERSLVNLSRIYGAVKDNGRRLAWLKTTIHSDRNQDRTLHLGFSDEVWLFVNGQILYIDKNHFGTPSQKFPRGRCAIENATVRLPLKEGKNEIMIGLASYFYGWGIIARLDDTDGIRLGD